jgi:hypothetical protein
MHICTHPLMLQLSTCLRPGGGRGYHGGCRKIRIRDSGYRIACIQYSSLDHCDSQLFLIWKSYSNSTQDGFLHLYFPLTLFVNFLHLHLRFDITSLKTHSNMQTISILSWYNQSSAGYLQAHHLVITTMQNISPTTTQSNVQFPRFLLRASNIYAKLVPELQKKVQYYAISSVSRPTG